MSVSDERIERAARAMWEVNPPNPPGWAPWGDRDGWGPSIPERRFTLAQARAALEADAPALEAARAEGLREARKAVEKCSSYEDRALYLHAIDARLSEMNQQPVDEGSVEQ